MKYKFPCLKGQQGFPQKIAQCQSGYGERPIPKGSPLLVKLMQKMKSGLDHRSVRYKQELRQKIQNTNSYKQVLKLQNAKIGLLNRICKLKVSDPSTHAGEIKKDAGQKEEDVLLGSLDQRQLKQENKLDFYDPSHFFYPIQSENPSKLLAQQTQSEKLKNEWQSKGLRVGFLRVGNQSRSSGYDNFNQVQFSSGQAQLLTQLIQHFCLLITWFKGSNLKKIIQFKYIQKLPLSPNQRGIKKRIHQLGEGEYMYAMEMGNTQQDLTNEPNYKKTQFSISKYFSQNKFKGEDSMNYLIDISQGFNQLISNGIYHIDVKTGNIIPVIQERKVFKFIDFEHSLHLKGHKIKEIIKLIINYSASKQKSKFIQLYFNNILFKEKEFQFNPQNTKVLQIGQLLKNIQENGDYFMKYVIDYSKLYYRKKFIDIFDEIKNYSQMDKNIFPTILDIIQWKSFDEMPKQLRIIKDKL